LEDLLAVTQAVAAQLAAMLAFADDDGSDDDGKRSEADDPMSPRRSESFYEDEGGNEPLAMGMFDLSVVMDELNLSSGSPAVTTVTQDEAGGLHTLASAPTPSPVKGNGMEGSRSVHAPPSPSSVLCAAGCALAAKLPPRCCTLVGEGSQQLCTRTCRLPSKLRLLWCQR
jgi:hypothetical protein